MYIKPTWHEINELKQKIQGFQCTKGIISKKEYYSEIVQFFLLWIWYQKF